MLGAEGLVEVARSGGMVIEMQLVIWDSRDGEWQGFVCLTRDLDGMILLYRLEKGPNGDR